MESYPREKSVYFLVNAALRAQDRGGVRPYRDYIWLLMHALRRLPPSPATIAHRSMKCALSALGDYAPKTEVSWGAFSSVSTDLSVMKDFLGKAGPRVPRTKSARPRNARKSWQHFEHLRTAMARTGRYEEEARHKAGVGANRPRVQR